MLRVKTNYQKKSFSRGYAAFEGEKKEKMLETVTCMPAFHESAQILFICQSFVQKKHHHLSGAQEKPTSGFIL